MTCSGHTVGHRCWPLAQPCPLGPRACALRRPGRAAAPLPCGKCSPALRAVSAGRGCVGRHCSRSCAPALLRSCWERVSAGLVAVVRASLSLVGPAGGAPDCGLRGGPAAEGPGGGLQLPVRSFPRSWLQEHTGSRPPARSWAGAEVES